MPYRNLNDPRNKEARLRHYYKNKEQYLDRNRKRKKFLREEKLRYILDWFKLHPCVDCGESDPVVLDFDHQKDKIANISKFIMSDYKKYCLEEMKKEVIKCEVRCANCHRRKTAKQFNHNRLILLNIAGSE